MRRIKPLFQSMIMLFFVQVSFAQTFDTTQYYGKMNFIFQNVNTSSINTGMLRDYGIDFLNLDNYTGAMLNDSNFVGLTEWRLLYASLYSEKINNNAQLLGLDTLNRLFSNNSLLTQPINFTTLYYNYQSLIPNAITSNLMFASNGQLFDVAGRSQSPYTSNELFGVAPLRQGAYTGVNQLVFNSSLSFGNTEN